MRAERRKAKRKQRNSDIIMVVLVLVTMAAGIWTLQAAAEVGRQLGSPR
jgi:nitrate reductase gamma subunit